MIIDVRHGPKRAKGRKEVKHIKGKTLKAYFRDLNLTSVAIHAAVYDDSNRSRGKCRLNYTPKEDAHIILVHPKMSRARFQVTDSSAIKKEVVTEMPMSRR